MPGFLLSDPHKDFTHPESRELLRGIIAKQGVGLTGYELACVFYGHLPAGTAAECCAYLRPLYQLFRNPQEEYAAQIWEDILWIWLVQERPALESLNQHQRIIDELRRIVHDTLLPAPWLPEQGAGGIYARAAMLSSWMASHWGEAETEDILNTLVSSGTAQQFILLRIFLDIKNPIGVAAPKKAFAAFAARFDTHFRESSALYDAALALSDLPLPANDSSGSTFHLKETLEECEWHL